MKLKLLFLLNKILKHFAFLSIFGISIPSHAQSVYQCMPCPFGTSASPGSIGENSCTSVRDRKGDFLRNLNNGDTFKLEPGWYRATIKTHATAKGSDQWCSNYPYAGSTYTGGLGVAEKILSFLFYVKDTANAKFENINNNPTITLNYVNEHSPTKTVGMTTPTNGGDAKCKSNGENGKESQGFINPLSRFEEISSHIIDNNPYGTMFLTRL